MNMWQFVYFIMFLCYVVIQNLKSHRSVQSLSCFWNVKLWSQGNRGQINLFKMPYAFYKKTLWCRTSSTHNSSKAFWISVIVMRFSTPSKVGRDVASLLDAAIFENPMHDGLAYIRLCRQTSLCRLDDAVKIDNHPCNGSVILFNADGILNRMFILFIPHMQMLQRTYIVLIFGHNLLRL